MTFQFVRNVFIVLLLESIPLHAQSSTSPKASPFDQAILQIALEQRHFSCGFIDGREGPRTTRAVRAFQMAQELPITGIADFGTREKLSLQREFFVYYTVTASDLSQIDPPPSLWKEKSKAKTLGYFHAWEMLAEKFHSAEGFLKKLNPKITNIEVGTTVLVPDIAASVPLPSCQKLRITLGETVIQGINESGKIVAHFPCSIAANKQKRPQGIIKVINYAPRPNYTFDPALFPEIVIREQITQKMIIPPGPNNPVGTAWIGLSLSGYGIHGTPLPEEISATQSHGCFRLSNWNAEKALKLIKIGMEVEMVP